MAKYELMFIVDPSLSEEDRNTSIDTFKSTLEKFSAKIEKEDIIGEKKLAYKINKSATGFYVLLDLEMN
jgi:small subunit ribosomal protein S6